MDTVRRSCPRLDSYCHRYVEKHNLGELLLVVYAIGAAIPMLAIAYGGQAVTTRVRSISRLSPQLQKGFGILVIAFAIASYFQYDTLIVAWLTRFYPNGQIGL